jgi:lysophospholipid acyltransferase (LPLAT)-like uncharacterized protein
MAMSGRRWRRPLRDALAAIAPPLLRVVGLLLLATLRIEYRNDAALRAAWRRGERVILAFWHNRLLLLPIIASGVPMCVMVSHHRDGEMATRLLRAWGVTTVRGSASRGAVSGFLRLVAAFRRGENLTVLPDGPRGPRYVAKPGVVHLAKALDAPIYPLAYAANRSASVRSWDRLLIPLPFARVVVEIGEPVRVPVHADGVELERSRAALEASLNTLTQSLESATARRNPPTSARAA